MTTPRATTPPPELERAVVDRTNAFLFKGAAFSHVASVAVGTLLLLGNERARTSAVGLAWLAGLVVLYAVRIALARRFLRQPTPDRELLGSVWRRRAVLGALAGGLWWAPGIVLLWSAALGPERMLLVVIIAGFLLGAVSSLAAVPAAFLSFAVPQWAAIVGCLFSSAEGLGQLITSAASLLLLPMLHRATQNMHGELDRSLRLDLEQAVLLKQLEVAKDAAVTAAGARSEFVAVMSHELRTPLNGVVGMTSLLLDTKLDATQREYAVAARDSAQMLLALLNGVLDHSRIDAGKLELERVDFELREELERVRSLFALKARERGLAFEVTVAPDVPAWVRGDWFRLRQVLVNLLGNALKFTEVGAVSCAVRSEAEAGGGLRLSFEVKDTGVGIAAEHVGQLFQPFRQADASTTRRFGGTGLGLWISRRLVELMQGRLSVTSQLGRGSTFSFFVVLEEGRAPVVETRSTPVPAAGPARVLVCDDNETNLRVAQRLLEKAGHHATPARTGEEALELLQQRAFDVVLMDLQMPTMDGFAALQRSRELLPAVRTPFVAVTASATQSDKDACLAAGFADFLTKPVVPEELVRAVERLTRGAA